MTATPTATISAILARENVQYTPAHVPTDFKPGSRDIAWSVTFSRNGQMMQTPFRQGIGHLPKHLHPQANNCMSVDLCNAITKTLKTGKYPRTLDYNVWSSTQKLTPPDAADVISCLILDASAADYGTYEQWAAEFGYPADSRKGEQTYQTCRETALNLYRVFGPTLIEELRPLCNEL